MNVLIDMNLSPAWCQFLRRHGHTCTHWSVVGDPRASDATIMHWARQHGQVVLTHDLDFGAILATTHAGGPSVVQIRTQDVMPLAIGDLVAGLLSRHESELAAGALIVVNRARSRVRILPLAR